MKTKCTRLCLAEREEISKGIYAFEKLAQIARRRGRSPSTITREVGFQVKIKKWCYSALRGEEIAEKKWRSSSWKKKLDSNSALLEYVQNKLRIKWSPEEIAERLKMKYTQDMSVRISHETIYQYLYCLPRGELKKELIKGLRQERKRRLSRAAVHYRRQRIEDIVSISERPKEAKGRIIAGYWEGDLIVGKGHASAVGTLVERTTRLTLLSLKEKTAFAVRSAFAMAFQANSERVQENTGI